ncbi:MAG: alanine dehydrogenase [Marinilabiliales bacterium]|nr:alanine dehydrogenase [Marinilabiliales bacterium]
MNQRKEEGVSVWTKEKLIPKEELYKPGKKNVKLSIGIPDVGSIVEFRVPLTPQSVEVLVANGHNVFVQKGAGREANYSDRAYAESGAVICENAAEIFQCDILLKMAPFTCDETEMMRGNQLLFSPVYLSFVTSDFVRKLMRKKVTAIGFEYLKDDEGVFPLVQISSEIIGNIALVVASELLSSIHGKGVILGEVTGVAPSEVVILGSGTIAEQAARTAMSLGAVVKVFDDSIHKLMNLKARLGQHLSTSVFHPKALRKALKTAEVVLGAMPMNEVPNLIVPEEMVEGMKENSVIIDLNIIQGGCFETSRITTLKNPTFKEHGVIHCCVPNLESRVARTASIAASNIFTPILLGIGQSGGVTEYIKGNRGFCEGVYMLNGILTNRDIARTLSISDTDINLLLGAF